MPARKQPRRRSSPPPVSPGNPGPPPPSSSPPSAAVSSGLAVPGPAATARLKLNQMIVSRRHQRRLDVELIEGDITAFNSRAYVLGVFQGVAPSGAAAAVDAGMHGALGEVVRRRMFEARPGEVFMLPATRRGLRADTVVLAGLGPFDRFDGRVQQLVCENVVRTLVAANIEEFACVLLGQSAIGDRSATLRHMLHGIIAGLLDADPRCSFRRVSLCERDPASAGELREALVREAATDLFHDVEVSFSEIVLPVEPETLAVRTGTSAVAGPSAYLLVRQIQTGTEVDGPIVFEQHLMGPTSRAALSVASVTVEQQPLKELLEWIQASSFNPHEFGRRAAELLLTQELRAELAAMGRCPLVILHDAAAARVPWETLRLADWSPALDAGLTRRYLASNLSTAKWSVLNQQSQVLTLLLVVDPTDNLNGAVAEGERIRQLFEGRSGFHLTVLQGPAATRARLMAEISSGRYDVIHYAGHAFFDPDNRARSGLVCANDQVLAGSDVAGLGRLPALMFFNACESARVRRWQDSTPELTAGEHADRNHGLAEAFMRGGIANLIGTYWPVGDASASDFAETFYARIVAGETLGTCLLAARRRIEKSSTDWADYILYGDADFRVKIRSEAERAARAWTRRG